MLLGNYNNNRVRELEDATLANGCHRISGKLDSGAVTISSKALRLPHALSTHFTKASPSDTFKQSAKPLLRRNG